MSSSTNQDAAGQSSKPSEAQGSVPTADAHSDGSMVIEGFMVHTLAVCEAPCPFHAPSDHPLNKAPIHIRGDKMMLVERICKHGIGHDDPDSVAYMHKHGQSWAGVHGCDGCCTDDYPIKRIEHSTRVPDANWVLGEVAPQTTNQNSLDTFDEARVLYWMNKFRHSTGGIMTAEIPGALKREFMAWHHQQTTKDMLALLPEKDTRTHAIKGVDQGIQIGFNAALEQVTNAIQAREEQ